MPIFIDDPFSAGPLLRGRTMPDEAGKLKGGNF